MAFLKRIYTLTAVFILCAFLARAQDRPIGYWRSHLPYNSALGMATDGSKIFTITEMAFFTYSPLTTGEMQAYSKIDGMSDVGMKCIGYDAGTATAVLVYANGNIDIFKDNTFYNIPDLKIKSVAGIKEVYSVYIENGNAYLSTSLGILVIDLANYNISETYQFIRNNQLIAVTGFTGSGAYFYATTPYGLYRAAKNNPELQNFQVWSRVDSTKRLNSMVSVNNTLFFADDTVVYRMTSDTLQKMYETAKLIRHIDSGKNMLMVCEFEPARFTGRLKMFDLNFQAIDSVDGAEPRQGMQLADGSIWMADRPKGLGKKGAGMQLSYSYPTGPNNPNNYDIYAYNKQLWIGHGGYNDRFEPKNWGYGYGMSSFRDEQWKTYQQYDYSPFGDSVADIVRIIKNEKDGTLYAGSYMSGLFILKADGSYELLKQNSLFDTSRVVYGAGQRQVIGIDFDRAGNLWVSTAFSQHQLYVRSATDNTWREILVRNAPPNGGPLVIDGDGQVWFACLGGNGIAVYNPEDSSSYNLTSGVGYGNLPSNNVFCIACDKNNNIWVGTNNGIGIVSNCNAPYTQSPPCDAEIPIVQYDQFAGYLFADNNVRTIAVDGANRKWVGTDNGIWLLSADASKIIYRFTAENSPLPSNTIQKISIDPITGDVYVGTDKGLVSYRSTAIDGGETNESVLVYPNPVPSGYNGTIAIKGLAANADVRITDINGQLVYRTKALGGQAVWSGVDYTGHRPQTGVYLIFVSNADGSQKYAGKIAFMN